MILLIIRAQPLSVLCKEGPKPSQVSYSDFPEKKKNEPPRNWIQEPH